MAQLSGSDPQPRVERGAMHPTSLPGGRLGAEAFAFVDWLAEAGQSWWQVLPLGPVGEGGSPYKSPSAFAGLARAAGRAGRAGQRRGGRRRCASASPTGCPTGRPSPVTGAGEDQVRFDREWTALRAYAAERGVRIIGDLPIYVAAEGADHRAHPELFQTGVQAGVPPDKLHRRRAALGQPALRLAGAAAAALPLVGGAAAADLAAGRPLADRPLPRLRRLLVGAGGRRGRERRPLGARAGPGALRGDPRRARRAAAGRREPRRDHRRGRTPAPRTGPAGDGGDAVRLRPGASPTAPTNSPATRRTTSSTPAPTTTTPRAAGSKSWSAESRAEFEREVAAAGIEEDEPWWALVRLTMSSRCRTCMLQMQDVLGLGSEARMNMPGTVGPQNWSWRMDEGALTPELAKRLRDATAAADRLRGRPERLTRASPRGRPDAPISPVWSTLDPARARRRSTALGRARRRAPGTRRCGR